MRTLIGAGVPVIVACALLTGPAGAGADPPLVDCWDGTFSYTNVGIRPAATGYDVRITSQDEALFSDLFPEAELDWGQAALDVALAEEACVVDPARALFSCRANEAALTLSLGGGRGGPEVTFATSLRGFVIELVNVMRAGEPPTAKLLLVEGTATDRDTGLRVNFIDYPAYCDGTFLGAFAPP